MTAGHYPIEFQSYPLSEGQQTKRERQIRARLIYCGKGEIAIRLGAHWYPLVTGQAYWLPENCLAAVRGESDSQVCELKFSARLEPLRSSAVQLQPTHLLEACIQALDTQDNLGGWQDQQGDILRLCYQQLLRSTALS